MQKETSLIRMKGLLAVIFLLASCGKENSSSLAFSAAAESTATAVPEIVEPEETAEAAETAEPAEDISDVLPESVLVWVKEPSMPIDSFFNVIFDSMPQYFPGTQYLIPEEREGYPAQYNKDSSYSADAVCVKRDGKLGFYNYDGNELMPCVLSGIEYKYDDYNICHIVDKETYRIISDDFRTLSDQYAVHYIMYPQDISAEVCVQNGKIGLWSPWDHQGFIEIDTSVLPEHVIARMLDENGEIECWCLIKNGSVIEQTFSELKGIVFRPLCNQTVIGSSEDDYNTGYNAFFDAATGERLTDYIYTGFSISSEGYSVAQKGYSHYVLLDEYGNEICDQSFENISAVYEGKAYVELDGNIGILDVNSTARENVGYADMEGAVGELIVSVSELNMRKRPDTGSESLGYAVVGKTYPVFETTAAQEYTWYRIGTDKWLADNGTWIEYHEKQN